MDIQKLMMAKAIMDKTTQMDNSGVKPQSRPQMQVENFSAPAAKYNIPSDMLESVNPMQQPVSTKFMNQGYPSASADAISKSKLPDEIKRLMLEHPIEQPNGFSNVGLSDDLIEKASRLMGTQRKDIKESVQETNVPQQKTTDTSSLKKMMKQVVKEVLKENGMLVESVERSNDNFKFQVGNHIFEGKLTKIKKLS
jgi:hypothetical protein